MCQLILNLQLSLHFDQTFLSGLNLLIVVVLFTLDEEAGICLQHVVLKLLELGHFLGHLVVTNKHLLHVVCFHSGSLHSQHLDLFIQLTHLHVSLVLE